MVESQGNGCEQADRELVRHRTKEVRTRRIREQTERRLSAYVAAAAAGMALAAPSADASVVGATINEPLVNGTATFAVDGQPWTLSGNWFFSWRSYGGIPASSHRFWASAGTARLGGPGYLMRSARSVWPEMLAAGAAIGSGAGKFGPSPFGSEIGWFESSPITLRVYGPCAFAGCGPGYFGIQFTVDGATHYGWILMELTGAPCQHGAEGSPVACSDTGEVFSYAYNTVPGESITAGDPPSTPEPGTLGLLALGSLGLGFWRRKKAARTSVV